MFSQITQARLCNLNRMLLDGMFSMRLFRLDLRQKMLDANHEDIF